MPTSLRHFVLGFALVVGACRPAPAPPPPPAVPSPDPQPVPGLGATQAHFEALHHRALEGMNIGAAAASAGTSGEKMMLTQFFRDPSRRYVVFDVGAYVGEYGKAVAETLEQREVYCFEPAAKSFATLTQNLGGRPGVQLFNLGLGAKAEEVSLYSDSEQSVLASVYKRDIQQHGIQLDKVEKIKLVTLDGFCQEHGIGHIDLLKLDVEGHELSVLQGAAKMLASDAIDFIQFEFGGCHIDARVFFRDFHRLLNPKYRIFRVLKDGLRPIDRYTEEHEVFLTTNYLAIARRLDPLAPK